MNRTSWAISVVMAFLCCNHVDAQTGRLQSMRDDARSSPAVDSSNSTSGGGPLSDFLNTSLGEDGMSLGSLAVGAALIAPFYLPAFLLDDNYQYRLPFAPHPYAKGYRGYQLLPSELASVFYNDDTENVPRKAWVGRVLLENGNDFAGLNRAGVHLKLETASRWGVITNWNYFNENLWHCRRDQTWIGDTNVTFRFAQNEIASMYTGLGFRMLTDRRQTDFGFNFTYGGDWFPVRPLVVSGVLDAGTLGSAGVIHLRGSVGAIWRGAEVFGGYDFLRIGGTNLQGPMAGVRFWF